MRSAVLIILILLWCKGSSGFVSVFPFTIGFKWRNHRINSLKPSVEMFSDPNQRINMLESPNVMPLQCCLMGKCTISDQEYVLGVPVNTPVVISTLNGTTKELQLIEKEDFKNYDNLVQFIAFQMKVEGDLQLLNTAGTLSVEGNLEYDDDEGNEDSEEDPDEWETGLPDGMQPIGQIDPNSEQWKEALAKLKSMPLPGTNEVNETLVPNMNGGEPHVVTLEDTKAMFAEEATVEELLKDTDDFRLVGSFLFEGGVYHLLEDRESDVFVGRRVDAENAQLLGEEETEQVMPLIEQAVGEHMEDAALEGREQQQQKQRPQKSMGKPRDSNPRDRQAAPRPQDRKKSYPPARPASKGSPRSHSSGSQQQRNAAKHQPTAKQQTSSRNSQPSSASQRSSRGPAGGNVIGRKR